MQAIPAHPIEEFLAIYSAERTRHRYRGAIRAIVEFRYGPQRAGRRATPEEAARYEPLARAYLEAPPDVVGDLIRFAATSTAAPMTAVTNMAALFEFFDHYGIEVSPRDRKKIRAKLPRGGAVGIEAELDAGGLRTIIQHMALNNRALALALVSSGMRVGEALQIHVRDVDLSASPAEVRIRAEYTKTKQQRTTFLSGEAAECIGEWLKIRDQYILSAANRGSGLAGVRAGARKTVRDPRLFPWDATTVSKAWAIALQKAGLHEVDSATGRATIHPHMLRKFFRSQLALSCPVDIVETLMGHQGYLTDAYRRYSRKQMAEYYLAAEHEVTIQVPAEYRDLKADLSGKLAVQAEINNGLTAKTLRMETRIDDLEALSREQARVIETLFDLTREAERAMPREPLERA